MNTIIKIEEYKKDYFQVSIKTYNGKIEGKFEKSELRHIIQQLDDAIGV